MTKSAVVSDFDRCLDLIYSVVEEFNETAEEESRLEKSPATVLFGDSGRLNSLELVSIIVGVEERVEEEFGAPVTIADEQALSQTRSPFRTIGSLAEYVSHLLGEAAGG